MLEPNLGNSERALARTRLNATTGAIIDSAIEVHRALGGPGLLESVYEEALAIELELRGIENRRQQRMAITYKGRRLYGQLTVDLLVADSVLVECKATTSHNEVFRAQTLTYVRLCKLEIGLLINFGSALLKHGIHRVVNDTHADASPVSAIFTPKPPRL